MDVDWKRWGWFILLLMASQVVRAELEVYPMTVDLRYATASQRFVVLHRDGKTVREVTSESAYKVEKSSIVEVSEDGVVTPLGDGTTAIRIRFGGEVTTIPVTTALTTQTAPVSFNLHIQPILAARGCSTGACHGKARGQNGFQLSLLGFDAEFHEVQKRYNCMLFRTPRNYF